MVSAGEQDLRAAVAALPGPVGRAMAIALRSGWFTIVAGGYESDVGVCPVAAAAKVAGVWRDNHAGDGGPDWGDEETPNPRCFEFAVCFDVYVIEAGIDQAIGVVRSELGVDRPRRRVAA